MLGPMSVELQGRSVAAARWPRRAQELVALLALAEDRRLARDRVLEYLWPHLDGPAGAANLRKAAHHARRALDDQEAVVLRGGGVELFPAREVTTDVESFLRSASDALRTGDPGRCADVARLCAGELLPDMLYEAWTQDDRRRVQARLAELLRRSGDLERLMEIEPTDEVACRELMRAAIEAGRRHVAIRWYERLRISLIRELGARPDPETRALYERCTTGVRLGEPAFVGRELELAAAMGELGRVAGGGTGAVVVRGTIGIGKSALCREIARRAADGGWRVLTTTSTASSIPYAPLGTVVEHLLSGGRAPLRRCPNARGRCSPSSARWPSRRHQRPPR
jgi:DNA-binding SARP family transcriptional activator